MSEHSPTPWKLTPNTLGNIEDANGRAIMQAQQTKPIRKAEDHAERLANAEITVRAVNSHDDLLAKLKALEISAARFAGMHTTSWLESSHYRREGLEDMLEKVGEAQKAIAAAENRATIQSAGGEK